MKVFEFAGFNSFGQRRIGTVKARSLQEAKRKIQQTGIYLASIGIKNISAPSKGSYQLFKWPIELLC